MSNLLVILISAGYLVILFGIAQFAENRFRKNKQSFLTNPYIYSLSLAVYCTAWTYYGSVGRAAAEGVEFLTIYMGPTLMAPLWWIILRKIIRIAKVQRLTTIADFISARYGKSIPIGATVTFISVLGIIPYIALQIKAISSSYQILMHGVAYKSEIAAQNLHPQFWNDGAFYLTIGLATFTIFFGTRQVETTERHEGMVTAIAFESVIKLVAFLCVGIFVCFFVFHGVGEIFQKAIEIPDLKEVMQMQEPYDSRKWFWMYILSGLAIICLPRQFQVAVVENVNEKHLNKAMWLFPLYLFLINLFVLPIALGGKLLFAGQSIDADTYVLALPLSQNHNILAIFTYIGGFSAATSMIIVETIALSTMLSNNLILPVFAGPELLQLFQHRLIKVPVYLRRLSILLVLLSAYIYYKSVAQNYSLVSIGLVSFAAVAQFAPSLIGGIFWTTGNRKGALAGMLLGFSVWIFTLLVPALVSADILSNTILTEGLFGNHLLRPFALMGLEDMDYISHTMFWSMSLNIGAYILVSLFTTPSSSEINQAEIFVNIFKYSTVYESSIVWKGKAYLPDIKSLLTQFLGKQRTQEAMLGFGLQNELDMNEATEADGRWVTYAEKLLSGVIGTASARIMIASVAATEEIKMQDVMRIVHETQEVIALNKQLAEQSAELQKATDQLRRMNQKLKQSDEIKDDFLTTVTHELRTPITSIRALGEILYDNPDLEEDERQHFLQTIVKETERISKLISQVLDLERYESGKFILQILPFYAKEMVMEAVTPLIPLANEKNITIRFDFQTDMPSMYGDEEKLIQVVKNLVSNAIKFANKDILITVEYIKRRLNVSVKDDGKGIAKEFQALIFEKFYQARNQTIRKPLGSGLGLAISKKIIQLHEGNISVESEIGKGTNFHFTIPVHRSFGE